MFSGIVVDCGELVACEPLGTGYQCVIRSELCVADSQIGDSVSVNGICSTITSMEADTFSVDYLEETKKRTTLADWTVGQRLNLELSLRPMDRMGGHVVTGHVDTVGQVIDDTQNSKWREITIAYPEAYRSYIVEKGSITIDGVSLTVVWTTPTAFQVHLIPHTVTHTNFTTIELNKSVNLEVDIMARYLYHFYTGES